MKTRSDLHEVLCAILGTRNVYYQPPESVKISYPAIIYKKARIDMIHADDLPYKLNNRYDILVIDKKVDNTIVEDLLHLPYCSYDRRYISDNLYHDALRIYL